MKIEEVLKEHADSLMSMSGVVGVGQGLCDGEPCIKVFLIKKIRDLEKKIPREIEGHKVQIEVIGEVKAFTKI